jgi:hypothetical protein
MRLHATTQPASVQKPQEKKTQSRKHEKWKKGERSFWFSFVLSSFRAFVVWFWNATSWQLGACSGILGAVEYPCTLIEKCGGQGRWITGGPI